MGISDHTGRAATGSLNVLAARLAGKKDARISVGNNALQFEGGLLGSDRSAFTAGNSVLYGPGGHPEMRARRYDKRPTSVSVGEHEMGHSTNIIARHFPHFILEAASSIRSTDALTATKRRLMILQKRLIEGAADEYTLLDSVRDRCNVYDVRTGYVRCTPASGGNRE